MAMILTTKKHAKVSIMALITSYIAKKEIGERRKNVGECGSPVAQNNVSLYVQ